MFVMTSEIGIANYRQIKAAKVTWKRSVRSYTDTCTIDLPRIIYMKTVKLQTEDVNQPNERQEYIFKEGDPVTVSLGYNNRNHLRFKGFIKRVNQGMPVNVECEGYSYLLYDVMVNKSYRSVTVKQLLKDITAKTAIVVSDAIPEIELKNITFKNASGIDVLEWLEKRCKLPVHFMFDVIFCGTQYGKKEGRSKLRIGWNTVKEDDFKKRIVDKNLRIVVKEKDTTGKVKKAKADSPFDNEKVVKVRAGMADVIRKQIANRLQSQSNYDGYQGKITTFLEPLIDVGMVVEIDGNRYPEMSGDYFCESISGEFGPSGGRQVVGLNFIASYGGS